MQDDDRATLQVLVLFVALFLQVVAVCCHLGLSYSWAFTTRTTHIPPFWLALYLVIFALQTIFSYSIVYPKLWAFYSGLMAVVGFLCLVAYAIIKNHIAAFWAFLWLPWCAALWYFAQHRKAHFCFESGGRVGDEADEQGEFELNEGDKKEKKKKSGAGHGSSNNGSSSSSSSLPVSSVASSASASGSASPHSSSHASRSSVSRVDDKGAASSEEPSRLSKKAKEGAKAKGSSSSSVPLCCLNFWSYCCCSFGALMAILLGLHAISLAASLGRFEAAGTFVEVSYDGSPEWNLHVVCKGESATETAPIVILEAGGGSSSDAFFNVQEILSAEGFRSCSYDRTGYGRSQSGLFKAGIDAVTLKDLMVDGVFEGGLASEVGRDFMLVGHSAGGQIITSLARSLVESTEVDDALLLDRLRGVVTLDSVNTTKWFSQVYRAQGLSDEYILKFMKGIPGKVDVLRYLAAFGLGRVISSPPAEFPKEARGSYGYAYASESGWNAQWYGSQYEPAVLDFEPVALPGDGRLRDLPFFVVKAGVPTETCEDKNLSGEDCERYDASNRIQYELQYNTTYFSNHSSFTYCESPCEHAFVWTHSDWVTDVLLSAIANATALDV